MKGKLVTPLSGSSRSFNLCTNIWHLVPEAYSTICKPLETQSMNVNKKIRELENVAFIKL